MIIEKIQRVANPTRRKRKYRTAKKRTKNPRKRAVKLSRKQIAAGFGGKRRKVAVKRSRPRATNPKRRAKKRVRAVRRRRAVRAANPVKRRAKTIRRRKRRASNPAPQIMALGYLNPTRRKKTVRKAKRRSTKRRATNPRRHVRRARRRVSARAGNPRRRVRRHRNPDFLGNGAEALGVLLGVAGQKIAKGFIPASLVSGNALLATGASFAVAFLIGKGADMLFKGKPMGKGVALGALASAASDAVGAFVPSLSSTIGLSGFGTYVNAVFAVPENPVMRGLPAPSVPIAAKGMGGALTAAFGNSF